MLSHAQLLQLKRWNTPTIYNGWEQITRQDAGKDGFNFEPVTDFMPQMGAMIGYAVTVVIEPSNKRHREQNPNAVTEYLRYLAGAPGPKIVVMQDVDKPNFVGAAWGECNANIHRALGCVGGIIDGAIRDVDEMTNAGFKALAQRLCVGHAYSHYVRWNCEVEVFGCKVLPGQLIHADKHGFLVIPEEDEAQLLDAALFMDQNECNTVIPAARGCAGLSTQAALEAIEAAGGEFGKAVRARFGKSGEWGDAEER